MTNKLNDNCEAVDFFRRRMLFSSNMEAKSSENNSSQKDNISNNDHKEPLNNTTKAGAVDAAVAEETFKQEKQKLLNQLNDYQVYN